MERRMLRHKATIQGARVAFGFSGITDEDEAAATPGLANARDVTPARSVPIDPFAEVPAEPAEPAAPVVEAEVVEQPADDPMDDSELVDFLDMVQGCEDAASLTKLVTAANAGFQDAKQQIAKRAINNKAKELGVSWSKEKGGFQ